MGLKALFGGVRGFLLFDFKREWPRFKCKPNYGWEDYDATANVDNDVASMLKLYKIGENFYSLICCCIPLFSLPLCNEICWHSDNLVYQVKVGSDVCWRLI